MVKVRQPLAVDLLLRLLNFDFSFEGSLPCAIGRFGQERLRKTR